MNNSTSKSSEVKKEPQVKIGDNHKATEHKDQKKKEKEGDLTVQSSVKTKKATQPSQQKSTGSHVEGKKEENIKKEEAKPIDKKEESKSHKLVSDGIKKTKDNISKTPTKRKISSSSEGSSSDESDSSGDEPKSIHLHKRFLHQLN